MDFDRFLDQLSSTELTSLRSKVDSRLGPPTSTAIEPDDPVLEAIFRPLSSTLTNFGHPKMPFAVFRGRQDFELFRTKAVHITKYVRKAFHPKSVIEFDFCYKLCFKLLGNWLQDIGVPLSYRTLINNSDRIASLVDQSFPGYRQAGFLHRIIQAQREKPSGRERARRFSA
jgi:hypothetical protein